MHNNIIINFPSNIGDAIMSLPVVEAISGNFAQSEITAIVSPNTKQFLARYNLINNVVLFDKRWNLGKKVKFAFSLRHKYDIFIDLKNTMLPVVAGAKKRTSFIRRFSKEKHKKDTHLSLIKKFCEVKGERKGKFMLSDAEQCEWDKLELKDAIFVCCASRSHIKQYAQKQLKEVIEYLKRNDSVIILGEERDREYYKDIVMLEGVIDLVGKTRMWDIAYLIDKYAKLVLAVDSSILHLSSFLNKPIVALFGPTDPDKFGPWSEKFVVVRNSEVKCSPCEIAVCRYNVECMDIGSGEVIAAVNKIGVSIIEY
ncbi:MAG: glycosyltransferase family 9 protein [Candidatus Omnitrophota bacterium]|nr:glycosyltransferase family 9 protein [Candidatus Omnitrophota bacterium]